MEKYYQDSYEYPLVGQLALGLSNNHVIKEGEIYKIIGESPHRSNPFSNPAHYSNKHHPDFPDSYHDYNFPIFIGPINKPPKRRTLTLSDSSGKKIELNAEHSYYLYPFFPWSLTGIETEYPDPKK